MWGAFVLVTAGMHFYIPAFNTYQTSDISDCGRNAWPAAQHDEAIARVKKGDDKNQFERVCISVISHPDANDDTFGPRKSMVRKSSTPP